MIKTESTCKKSLKLFLGEYNNYLKSSLKKKKKNPQDYRNILLYLSLITYYYVL